MINKVLYIGMTVISLVLLNLVPVMAALESEYFVPTLVGSSARMIRLGNIEGFSHEASSIFENPAGLYRVNRMSSSAFTTTFMEEVTYQNVAMAMRMPIGVLGVGYMGLGVDEIPRTFKNEVKEFDINGYFGYKNSMAKVAYQLSQSRHLHFGGSFSYYLTEFDTVKASGYNVDLGVVVDSDVLDASIVVKNVLKSSKIRYTDATEVTDIEDYSSRGKEEVLPFQTIYSMKYSLQNFQWYGQLKTVGRERQFVKSFGVDFSILVYNLYNFIQSLLYELPVVLPFSYNLHIALS